MNRRAGLCAGQEWRAIPVGISISIEVQKDGCISIPIQIPTLPRKENRTNQKEVQRSYG
jgi:hypothetical protein